MTASTSPPVQFEALFNLRDLGGATTSTGETIRPGVLFRSDCLDRCTNGDLQRLADMDIRTVVDLRGIDEVQQMRSVVGATWRNIPLLQRAWEHDALAVDASDAVAVAFLLDQYFGMLDSTSVIRDAFEVVSNSCDRPVLFHCAAGKDRTGLLAAIILSVLGVDDTTIAADYTLTGPAMRTYVDWLAVNDPDMLHLWTAAHPALWDPPAEVILGTLQEIRRRRTTIETFLLDAGVSRASLERLRANLLMPA